MMGRFFIEGLSYSEHDLAAARIDAPDRGFEATKTALDPQQTSGDEIVRCLLSMSIGEKRILRTNAKGDLIFNYVGVIALYRHVFIILPKYYVPDGRQVADMPWLTATAQDILAAVSRYREMRGAVKTLDDVTFSPASPHVTAVQNQMGLYRFLLQDYAEHGPYREAIRIRERNGEGLIDWPDTINRINPVVTGSRPAYMELITTRHRLDESNFIARVQESIIMEICTLMESSGLGDLFRLPSFTLAVQTLDALGDAEYLITRLERELTTRFDTRSKLLLNALIDYLRGNSRTVADTVVAEGTASFNLVWESICQRLFHDRSNELRMPKPHWTYRLDPDMTWDMNDASESIRQRPIGAAGQSYETTGTDGTEERGRADPHTLIPDVINKDDPTGWYILDAKYYIPTYETKSICGAPGIGDIIKQYFYMMALAGGKAPITVLGNAFIVPGRPIAGTEPETTRSNRQRYRLLQRGNVKLDFIGAFLGDETPTNDPEIKLFEMNPEQAIRLYLDPSEDGVRAGAYLKAMFRPTQVDRQGFSRKGIPADVMDHTDDDPGNHPGYRVREGNAPITPTQGDGHDTRP